MRLLVMFMLTLMMSHARNTVKDARKLCIACGDEDIHHQGICDGATVEACSMVLGAWSSVHMGASHGIDMNTPVSGAQFKKLWEGDAGYSIHRLDAWLCMATSSDTSIKCEGWANFSAWTVYDAAEHVYADMDDWLCTMRYLWVPAFVSSKTGGRIRVGHLIELPTDAQCDEEL